MNIYIDIDGTLLSDEEDRLFTYDVETMGQAAAIVRYEARTISSDLAINWRLVSQIASLKGDGHTIIGWTNRPVCHAEATLANIAVVASLFDEVTFHAGMKGESVVDGLVIDNEKKYVNMGNSSSTTVQW